MKMLALLSFCIFAGYSAIGQELIDTNDREPASVTPASASKRTYVGGGDEEDLLVQARLPEASLKTDARTVQRGVFKTLYNQEMKEERQENVEE